MRCLSLILLLWCIPFDVSFAQVVLSEVMYDAVGSDSHDEFVEIVNLSETESVDLSGWQISDGSASDKIVAAGMGTILQPGQFAVILDASYFENSTTYDAILPDSALVLTIDNLTFGKSGFSNSTPELVILTDSSGTVISRYQYSLGNAPGHSDEKVLLNGPDSHDNWKDSTVLFGTPGRKNSVSPLDHDLAILSDDFNLNPAAVQEGAPVTATVTVRNLGTVAAGNFSVRFFDDRNLDGSLNEDEAVGPPLDFNGRLNYLEKQMFETVLTGFSSGEHLLYATVISPQDQNLTNNSSVQRLLVSFADRALVVNEIMYSPLSGQAEWVELFNPGTAPVSVAHWSISDADSTGRASIPGGLSVPPGGFFVLTQDASVFDFFSVPEDLAMVVPGFPSLNNNADTVYLYDLTGHVVDRVAFKESWGGGAGISLEKINPTLSADDSSNWSSSVAVAGGTPAAQNSIFTRSVPTRTKLSISPNPFSPDGDGMDDFAIIHYRLPVTTASINLKIYDLRGRLIRYLANNRSSGANGDVVWDGRDNAGETARIGIYVVFLQAIQPAGGVIASHKQTVVLAGKL